MLYAVCGVVKSVDAIRIRLVLHGTKTPHQTISVETMNAPNIQRCYKNTLKEGRQVHRLRRGGGSRACQCVLQVTVNSQLQQHGGSGNTRPTRYSRCSGVHMTCTVPSSVKPLDRRPLPFSACGNFKQDALKQCNHTLASSGSRIFSSDFSSSAAGHT
jgi:hypothetical protein